MDKIEKVMGEFKRGKLHSGSKKGPIVKNKKQAMAIAMSEAKKGKKYAHGGGVKKYATGGKVSAGPVMGGKGQGAGSTCRGMGAAKKGGSFSGIR